MTTQKKYWFNRVLHKSKTDSLDTQAVHSNASRVIKKLTVAILSAAMLFTMAACTPKTSPDGTVLPDPTGTVTDNQSVKLPEYEKETVLLKDIGGYSIVYPSDYTDDRRQDVEFLQEVIKDIIGANLKIISDLEPSSGKEIIIASSKRKNGVEEALEKFESRLDYVVAVRNGNIILGGNNFYANVKAIYDFINNTLGYDDVENERKGAKNDISGVNYMLYSEPKFLISAHNGGVEGLDRKKAIRDMSLANFTVAMIDNNWHTDEQILTAAKWCAVYNMWMMVGGVTPTINDKLADCPVVYSTIEVDEPGDFLKAAQTIRDYKEKYSKYGWKPFMNFVPITSAADMLIEWEGVLDDVHMISFDVYPEQSLEYHWTDTLACYERYNYIARKTGKDLWTYIESEDITFRQQNTSKMFRWQGSIALSFGTKNILYFQYGDYYRNAIGWGDFNVHPNAGLINEDLSRNPAWYDAQIFNGEVLKMADLYDKYASKGAITLNAPPYVSMLNFSSPYEGAKDIVSDYICEDAKNIDAYLLGFFDKRDNDKAHAFTIVNISDLNEEPYGSEKPKYVKFKINGEKVTFYRNGEIENVEKTSDGYYRVNMANGFCWFVTVD